MGSEQNRASWEQVCELVAEALELQPAERDSFLRDADVPPDVRAEAVSLVAASVAGDSKARLLDQGLPALDALAESFEDPVIHSRWIGRRLGPYVVERELGHGGMGLVLLARRADSLYQRAVAIKVVRSTLAQEEFARRFRRETRILARLQHPAIVTLLDAGTTEEEQPYFVMEYIDGSPIHVYAEREALRLPQLLDLVITLCDALGHAHAQGVIHRDIKPGNVLVSASGELKLLDFGIARLAAAGAHTAEQTLTQFRAVTPTYASPEQIAGEAEVTSRSDIYSVGVLLYVLLTGRAPFELTGLTTAEIERVLKTAQPVLPSRAALKRFSGPGSAALDAVVGRAMEPDPARRYDSMDALKLELQRLRAEQQPLASPRRYYARRWWRAHQTAVKRASMCAAAAAALVAAGTLWAGHERSLAARPVVEEKRVSLAVVPIASAAQGAGGVQAAAEEAIETELGSGDQIRVVPSATVAQAMRDLKLTGATELDKQQTQTLGALLGADYLVGEKAAVRENTTGPAETIHLQTSLDRVRGDERIPLDALDTTADGLGAATQQIAVNVARLLPLKRSFSASPSLLPHQAAAVRMYADGLEHLQAIEPVPAQRSLSQAAAVEPNSPLIHVALARAWDMLGYRQRAVDEAGKAIGLSAGLPMRTKLAVEAPADEITRQWLAAITVYKTLRDYDPDDVDYVLGLARSQLAANQAEDALRTLAAAASMPSLLGADPRIELLTSIADESLGRHEEALRHADAVYAASRERNATQLMAQAQAARASALESLGRVDQGLAAAKQAEALFSAAGDVKGRGAMLISTGNFLEDHAKYADAKDAYTQARTIFAQLGDEERLAVAENDLGIIAMDVGDAEEGLAQYAKALQISRKLENLPRIAAELNNIGLMQKELGNIEAAKASYTASLRVVERLHDNRQIARAYNNLGSLLLEQGKLDEAEQDYGKAYAIYSGQAEAANALRPLMGEAHVSWLRGRLAEAHARYQQAIQLSRQAGEPKLLGTALRADAHVLHDAGEEGIARQELKESENLRQANYEAVALAETKLSGVLFDLDQGQAVEPASRLAELLDIFASKKQIGDEVSVELAWARSLLLGGDLPGAQQHFRAAQTMAAQSRDASIMADLLPVRARLLAAAGNHGKAETVLDEPLAHARSSGNIAAAMDLRLTKMEVGDARFRRAMQRDYVQKATDAGFLRAARRMESF